MESRFSCYARPPFFERLNENQKVFTNEIDIKKSIEREIQRIFDARSFIGDFGIPDECTVQEISVRNFEKNCQKIIERLEPRLHNIQVKISLDKTSLTRIQVRGNILIQNKWHPIEFPIAYAS